MYFITGGRGTQSGLYRVTYEGPKVQDDSVVDEKSKRARQTRRRLEKLHGIGTKQNLNEILPWLIGTDPSIRFAARVALEAVPADFWKAHILNTASLTELLALARVGSAPDQSTLLKRVAQFRIAGLSEPRRLAKLRVIQVSLARHGLAASKEIDALVAELIDFLPRASAPVKLESMRVLLHVNPPGAVSQAVKFIQDSTSREETLSYVELLRNIKDGWTRADRESFFAWFLPGNQKPRSTELNHYFADVSRRSVDGAGYDGYLRDFRRQAIATLTADERKQLEPLLAKSIAQAQLVPATPRDFVRDWKLEDLLADLQKNRQPDLDRGRQAFVDAQCLTCHRFGNDGGNSGPELTSARSKYGERDLLESILEPSKVISDQYQDQTAFLKDGDVVTGRLVSESDQEIVLEVDRVAGTRQILPRANINRLRPATLSPMPTGLANVLSKEEILDLIAYLRNGVEIAKPNDN
jgi:putative heme-binding domain-containing protein